MNWTRVEIKTADGYDLGAVYYGQNEYGFFSFRYFEEENSQTEEPEEELFDFEGYIKGGCMHWGTDNRTEMHFCDEADVQKFAYVLRQIWALELSHR